MPADGSWRADFFTVGGRAAQGWESIVPVLAQRPDGRIELVGTAFFVAHRLAVTAAHVIRDETDPLAILQYSATGLIGIRPISAATCHLVHDVAVLSIERTTHQGSQLLNPRLILTRVTPTPGQQVSTWAFPNATSAYGSRQGSLFIAPKLYVGEVRTTFPDGRDRVMLPGRSYETSLAIEGGASGGPVFESRGHVFAVNSTGIDGTDIGYVSHIQSIGGLPVPKFEDSRGNTYTDKTIHDLIEMGEIEVRS